MQHYLHIFVQMHPFDKQQIVMITANRLFEVCDFGFGDFAAVLPHFYHVENRSSIYIYLNYQIEILKF